MKTATLTALLAMTFALPVLANGGRAPHRHDRRDTVAVSRGALEKRLDAMERLVASLQHAREDDRGGDRRRDDGDARGPERRGERRDDRDTVRALKQELSAMRAIVRAAPPSYLERPPMPPPPPMEAPMMTSPAELERLKQAVNGESFSADKLRVLANALAARHLSVPQTHVMLKVFTFSGDRLKALELMAPHTVDLARNGYQLFDAFDFSTDKEKARSIIERNS